MPHLRADITISTPLWASSFPLTCFLCWRRWRSSTKVSASAVASATSTGRHFNFGALAGAEFSPHLFYSSDALAGVGFSPHLHYMLAAMAVARKCLPLPSPAPHLRAGLPQHLFLLSLRSRHIQLPCNCLRPPLRGLAGGTSLHSKAGMARLRWVGLGNSTCCAFIL